MALDDNQVRKLLAGAGVDAMDTGATNLGTATAAFYTALRANAVISEAQAAELAETWLRAMFDMATEIEREKLRLKHGQG